MLWEAIGPLPDSSERHEGGLLFGESDRQGRSRQYRASGSPIRDRFKSAGSVYPKRSSVAQTRPSPGFFSRSDRSVFFPDGRLYQYACRRAVRLSALASARAEVPKRRLCNSFSSKGHGLGTVLRSLCRNEEVEQNMTMSFGSAPAETLVQANALGAHVAVRTSQRGSQNSDCRVDSDVRGDAYARAHKICAVPGARCSGCLCGLAGFAVCCPRSRRTYRTWKWLGNCAHGLGRVDCSCTTAGRS